MSVGAAKMLKSEELTESILEKRGKYIHKKLREFRKNSEWIAKQREKLRKKYPNIYIAVRGQKVIAKHKNFLELLSSVEKIPENEDIVIDYISSKRLKLLL